MKVYVDREKMLQVIKASTTLGFQMGATSMRLKVMETLMPYLENKLLDSGLITIRDIIKMVGDTLIDFDVNQEYEKMQEMMDGMMKLDENDDRAS